MRWFLLLAALLCGPSANAQMMQAVVNAKTAVTPPTWTIVASAQCQFTTLSSGCTTSAINTTGANLILSVTATPTLGRATP